LSLVRRSVVLGAAFAPLAARAAPIAPPRRIVSLFPCIDAILLRVADPDQIAGLSALSRQAEVSSVAGDEARRYPSARDDAEALLSLKPDLVAVSRYTASTTLRALRRAGVRLLIVEPQRSVAESLSQVHEVAQAVGHTERGEALAARIAAALDHARPEAPDHRPGALVFQNGGFVAGPGSLIDDMLNRTGFSNRAAAYGVKDFGEVSLERIVRDPPQVLLAAEPKAGAPGFGERVLRHPALLALKDTMRIEAFPQSLLLCGGPVLLQTAPRLAAIRRRVLGGAA
jgi:iron complex transport system substrate-binding protein